MVTGAQAKIGGGGILDGSGYFWWTNVKSLPAGRPHLVEVYNTSNFEVSHVHSVVSSASLFPYNLSWLCLCVKSFLNLIRFPP